MMHVVAGAVRNMSMSIRTGIDIVKTGRLVCVRLMVVIGHVYRKRLQSIRYLRIL